MLILNTFLYAFLVYMPPYLHYLDSFLFLSFLHEFFILPLFSLLLLHKSIPSIIKVIFILPLFFLYVLSPYHLKNEENQPKLSQSLDNLTNYIILFLLFTRYMDFLLNIILLIYISKDIILIFLNFIDQ